MTREEVVEVVGDAARELADGLHLLRLAELLLEVVLAGDVALEADVADHLARGVAHRGDDHFRHVVVPVLPAVDEDAGEHSSGGERVPHPPVDLGSLHAALEEAGVLADGLGGAVAGHPLERRVDVLDRAGGVRDECHLARLRERGAEQRQFLGCALAFGHVAEEDEHARLAAVREGDGVDLDVERGAVAPDEHHLGGRRRQPGDDEALQALADERVGDGLDALEDGQAHHLPLGSGAEEAEGGGVDVGEMQVVRGEQGLRPPLDDLAETGLALAQGLLGGDARADVPHVHQDGGPPPCGNLTALTSALNGVPSVRRRTSSIVTAFAWPDMTVSMRCRTTSRNSVATRSSIGCPTRAAADSAP